MNHTATVADRASSPSLLQKLGMSWKQHLSFLTNAVLVLCRVQKALEEKAEREERKDFL